MSFPKWPNFDEDEILKVSKILKSGKVNYWTGEEGKSFEKEFSVLTNSKYSIAISNGSLALSCCYLALGLKAGDEVITTPRTFIATSSALVLLGYKPVFADVDLDSGLITAETIEPFITKKTKAISVVHLGGWPADMSSICELAKKYNLYVIEDCAQAHGAKIKIDNDYKSVGSFGDISAWSFCQDKIMSTGGEGGMITTNKKKYWELVWSFKDHGKSFNKVLQKNIDGGFRWLHDSFGSNFRLTEMQSVIGRSQIKKLENWNLIRNRNAKILIEGLSNCSCIRIPKIPDNIIHAYYRFYCYLHLDSLSTDWDRKRIIHEIVNLGYPAFEGTCGEIYLENCFTNSGITPKKRLNNASALSSTSLCFLTHPSINKFQMHEYVNVIKNVLDAALRKN